MLVNLSKLTVSSTIWTPSVLLHGVPRDYINHVRHINWFEKSTTWTLCKATNTIQSERILDKSRSPIHTISLNPVETTELLKSYQDYLEGIWRVVRFYKDGLERGERKSESQSEHNVRLLRRSKSEEIKSEESQWYRLIYFVLFK